MAINTTGTPTTNDYWIGRGILYLAELNADDTPKSFKDVGNVPELTLTVDSENYDHFSSRAGLKVLDKSIVIEQTANTSFILENVKDFGNLKRFFSGDAAAYVNPAAAGYSGATLVTDGNIEANAWYTLVDNDGKPVFQIDKAKVTVQTTDGTPVVLVLDTDYTVNEVSGMIFLNDTATVQSAITGAVGLTSTLAVDANAGTVDVMQAQTKSAVTVALRFIGENAADGTKLTVDMHKVTISADGDFSLISDEVTQAPMTGSVEKSETYDATVDVYDAAERTA